MPSPLFIGHEQPRPVDVRLNLPVRSSADLDSMRRAMIVIADAAGKKISAQQMLFLFAVAKATTTGEVTRLSLLIEKYPALGPAVERAVGQYLEPTSVTPDALGWIRQTNDPKDKRTRNLGLTAKGSAFMAKISTAVVAL